MPWAESDKFKNVSDRGELMKPAPFPVNEKERMACLPAYEILDILPEKQFDDLTFLTSCICQTPVALISLVDSSRQWFKSHYGFSARQTSREVSFFGQAILNNDSFIVTDTLQDPRFSDNPQVIENPHIRFYAGIPLQSTSGHNLGTLCVIDYKPRVLTEDQIEALEAISHQVMDRCDMRIQSKKERDLLSKIDSNQRELNEFFENVPVGLLKPNSKFQVLKI